MPDRFVHGNAAPPGIATAAATVLIAEPEELTRESLAAFCAASGRYQPVALVADGEEALTSTRLHRPELAIVNLDLPRLHAHELIAQCLDASLPTRFVVLANRFDRKTVLESLRAGAKGFVLRSGSARNFFDALDQARLGGVYLAPQVGANWLFVQPGQESTEDPIGHLSSREYQVFTMLVDGVRAKEIAARLELSPKTVDTYRASLMRKLDIHDVAGLVKFAVRRNLVANSHHA
jgi:DNA-binding NarL/FixJ family response regulator